MKRTTSFLIGLLAVAALGYFVFIQFAQGGNDQFHVEDPAAITRIELSQLVKGKPGEKAVLEKKTADEWLVDGKYSANQPKVESFLKTLTQIRVKSPIEEAGQNTALSLLKKSHTRVKVYGPEDVLIEYLIGPTDSKHKSNIMMLEGGSKAYLVSKPGQSGYVSVFYSTTSNNWRELLLFNLEGKDLAQVSVTYADSVGVSYALSRGGEGSPWALADGGLADPVRVENYQNLFEGKTFAESLADQAFPELRDSLARRTPDVSFAFATLEGKKGELRLFIRPENPNNYFGYLEGQPDLYTVQHYVMDKFLKTRSFFISSPS